MSRSVLMFCSQFRPIVGGAERQVEKLSLALAETGHRVKIVTPLIAAGTPRMEVDNGVEIHRFPLFDVCQRMPAVRGLGPLNLISIRAQVMRAVSRHLDGVDILHAHIAAPLSAFAMQAAVRRGIPTLCKVAIAGERTDLRVLSGIGIGGPSLARTMVRDLDRWVATTGAVHESLTDFGVPAERIDTIPNGVVVNGLGTRTPTRRGPQRFLYMGRLSTNIRRDVPTLIRAFDRLADEYPDVELAVVGGGDLLDATRQLISMTRHHARIRAPGEQPPESWFDWADCFVLPSRAEGLSNALLEAMAKELPCIANDIPANREVLDGGSAGILVPISDEDRLVSEMKRLIREPATAADLAKAAGRRVREVYAIEAVVERYSALYEVLISQRTRAGDKTG